MVQKKPPTKRPKQISDVRTPFGTRVMKTITCSSCGKTDQLSFVPKDGRPILCRRCAERDLDVIDATSAHSSDRLTSCKHCKQELLVERRPAPRREDEALPAPLPEELGLCQDCRLALRAERRKVAKKPKGVHPLVIKRGKE